jgi:hypothetical protein
MTTFTPGINESGGPDSRLKLNLRHRCNTDKASAKFADECGQRRKSESVKHAYSINVPSLVRKVAAKTRWTIFLKSVKSRPHFMKNDPLTGTLTGVLVISVLASIFFFYQFVSKSHQVRDEQGRLNFIVQVRRPGVGQMVMEVLEYSKTHPAIDPILEQTGVKQKASSLTNKPAIK